MTTHEGQVLQFVRQPGLGAADIGDHSTVLQAGCERPNHCRNMFHRRAHHDKIHTGHGFGGIVEYGIGNALVEAGLPRLGTPCVAVNPNSGGTRPR